MILSVVRWTGTVAGADESVRKKRNHMVGSVAVHPYSATEVVKVNCLLLAFNKNHSQLYSVIHLTLSLSSNYRMFIVYLLSFKA
jgi:hypothetical protein